MPLNLRLRSRRLWGREARGRRLSRNGSATTSTLSQGLGLRLRLGSGLGRAMIRARDRAKVWARVRD